MMGIWGADGPRLRSRRRGFRSGVGSSPRSCLQVTVGSGRPTARQSRFTLPPSFTVTGAEMFTMRAGTAGCWGEVSGVGVPGSQDPRVPATGPSTPSLRGPHRQPCRPQAQRSCPHPLCALCLSVRFLSLPCLCIRLHASLLVCCPHFLSL